MTHHHRHGGMHFLGILTMWIWVPLLIGGITYAVAGPYKVPSTNTAVMSTCHAGGYADRYCTPGAMFAHVTRADVCTPGWSSRHRNTPDAQRYRVFAAYGIDYADHSKYEFDHLIPLEAGGSNADANMWPELLPGAKVKDKVENDVHAKICRGERTISQIRAYLHRKYTRRY